MARRIKNGEKFYDVVSRTAPGNVAIVHNIIPLPFEEAERLMARVKARERVMVRVRLTEYMEV